MIAKDWVLLGGSRKERHWLCLCCGAVIIEKRWHRDGDPFGPMTRGLLNIGFRVRVTRSPLNQMHNAAPELSPIAALRATRFGPDTGHVVARRKQRAQSVGRRMDESIASLHPRGQVSAGSFLGGMA